jgi:hypothetical protein
MGHCLSGTPIPEDVIKWINQSLSVTIMSVVHHLVVRLSFSLRRLISPLWPLLPGQPTQNTFSIEPITHNQSKPSLYCPPDYVLSGAAGPNHVCPPGTSFLCPPGTSQCGRMGLIGECGLCLPGWVYWAVGGVLWFVRPLAKTILKTSGPNHFWGCVLWFVRPLYHPPSNMLSINRINLSPSQQPGIKAKPLRQAK